MNAVSIRGSWVGQVVDGRFLLVEWLGGSSTSGAFVTELAGPDSQKAVIKLFSMPAQAEERLSTWTEIASLSHVSLVRILHFGRAEIDGAPLVYVVTEYAEEVLSQIIPDRPLTADETREMLDPILDGLSYLHAKNYVHAHLKPSNILVVENEVKLSVDGVVAEYRPVLELESADLHNAPEAAANPIAPPADSWSLGVTLVEALTRQLPVWDLASDTDPELPELPKPFDLIASRCLRIDPADRCSLSDVRLMLADKAEEVSPLEPEPEVPRRHIPPEIAARSSKARFPVIPIIVGLILLVAIVVGLVVHGRKTDTSQVQTESTSQQHPAEPVAQPAAAPPPVATGQPATGSSTTVQAKGEVLNRVVPDVPQKASDTIEGRVRVAVRVTVDATGSVTNAEFASQGSSAYFARLAMESARQWKFKPPQQNGRAAASEWLLHYEFKRTGADVSANETAP